MKILVFVFLFLVGCGSDNSPQPIQPVTKKTQEESHALIDVFLSKESDESRNLFLDKVYRLSIEESNKGLFCLDVSYQAKTYSAILPNKLSNYLSILSKVYEIDYATNLKLFNQYQEDERQFYMGVFKNRCEKESSIYNNKIYIISSDVNLNWNVAYNSLIINS